jgi:hypothetical protein
MAWDADKCKWGTPSGFSDSAADTAVKNADFSKSVYVNISAKEANTKQAFTYYDFGGYRLCVVGHVHKNSSGGWTIAGNAYIPGWADWSMTTPAAQVTAIGSLGTGGSFPGDNRYPHPISSP